VIDIFDYAGQHTAPGPAQAWLDELPHQDPVLNEPATEAVRRLARRYLNQLNSQVVMVRMEPAPTGIMVVITLAFSDTATCCRVHFAITNLTTMSRCDLFSCENMPCRCKYLSAILVHVFLALLPPS